MLIFTYHMVIRVEITRIYLGNSYYKILLNTKLQWKFNQCDVPCHCSFHQKWNSASLSFLLLKYSRKAKTCKRFFKPPVITIANIWLTKASHRAEFRISGREIYCTPWRQGCKEGWRIEVWIKSTRGILLLCYNYI